MNTQTTRRALIGGAGLAAVVAMAPAVATVRAPAISTAKWDALVATFRKADAHMKAIGAEHDAAYKRYGAAVEKLGPRPRACDYSNEAYPKPINEMTVGELRSKSLPKSPEYVAYEVALAAWKAKDDALEAEVTGDVDARWEAAVDAQDTAAHVLFTEPSPTPDALRFKLDLAEVAYQHCDLADDVTAAIFADVRRLLSKEA